MDEDKGWIEKDRKRQKEGGRELTCLITVSSVALELVAESRVAATVCCPDWDATTEMT